MKPIGPRRTAPPVARPDGFEAPYDAFEPRFLDHDEIVLVIFGIETRSGDGSKLKSRLLDELQRVDGPAILEHGAIVDGFGPKSEVWFGYWKTQEQYEIWLGESQIESLFADDTLLGGDIGLWREYCLISLDYNETSYSRSDNISGLGNFSDAMEVTPHHAYWGSARDRIVAAAEDDLAGPALENRAADGFGRRVQLVAPANACLIKTSQDLSQATPEQFAIYRQEVEPALHAGLRDIRENPVETGSYGMRFIEEVGGNSTNQPRTIGLGYFASLADLEQWTHHSPTHGAIMAKFGAMVEQFQGQPGVHLWHEVTVFPKGSLCGDYVNCSGDGTLMALV